MIFSFKSDKGNIREINEDSFAYSYSKEGHFCAAIADGMGGHSCGEIASKLAAEMTVNYMVEVQDINENNVQIHMENAVENANIAIINKAKESGACFGMGTTLVFICIIDSRVYIEHVGDSRAYLIHDGVLSQLTDDHSYIEELVKTGNISREDASNHPKKNIITKALGTFDSSEPEFSVSVLKKNDIVLLCTDGLTNTITNEELAQLAVSVDSPEKMCKKLISTALKNGGKDNVTVAVIKL